MTPLTEADEVTTSPAAPAQKASSGAAVALAIVVASMLMVGAGVWAAVALGGREPQTVAITVPRGTSVRLAMGEEVDIMPSRLEFFVGDTIYIRNDDVADHSVGPYSVKAGEEMRLRYGAAGVYEGYCPLSSGERYEIVVKD